MSYLAQLILYIGWIAGIVISVGFWQTFFACIIPIYSWYLIVERILSVNGML